MNQHSNNTRSVLFVSLTCVVALAMGCAPAFETNKSASNGGTNTGSGSGGGGGGTDSPAWKDIDLNGSINGGRFDRTKAVEIDPSTKTLVVRLPFIAGIQVGAELPLPIKEIPGATIGVETNSDGSSAIVLRLPLANALRGVDSLPSSRLPNGEPLPAIPDGELPSLGFSLSKSGNMKGALYLSPTIVGVFVATKFDPFIRLTLPIRNEARTRTLGYFTTIPEKTGFDGGFFLSIAIPDDIARAIDDLL